MQQLRITTLLEAHKIPFNIIDVADDDDALERMRTLAENETALPPQIANGDEYCGVSTSKYLFLFGMPNVVNKT